MCGFVKTMAKGIGSAAASSMWFTASMLFLATDILVTWMEVEGE